MNVCGFEIPLQCNYCNKSFSGAIPAKQHFDSAAHKKKEATARQAASAGTSSLLLCDVCNVSCDTIQILDQHKASPRHLAMIEKKQQFVQTERCVHQASSAPNPGGEGVFTPSYDPFQRGLPKENLSKEYDFDGNRGYCYLCDIELTSNQHATQHLNGSRHKKKQVLHSTMNMRPPQSISPQVFHGVQRNVPTNYSQMDNNFAFEETQEKQIMSSPAETKLVRPVQSSSPVIRPVQSRSPVQNSSPVVRLVQSSSPVVRPFQSGSAVMRPVQSDSPSHDKLYCEVCDIRVESLDVMVDHLKSSKHETNLLNKSIKSSRSSSVSSANDLENMSGNNPHDYVSYSAINQQMSELMLSDDQQLRNIQNIVKPEPVYGDHRDNHETENKLQKFFNIDSANLKVDSLLSEEGSLSYRTAEEPVSEEIIAKPFPTEGSQGGIASRQGFRDNRQNETSQTNTSETAYYDGHRVINRSISSCTTSSEPGPAEFIRNNLLSPTGDIGPSSMPALVNNANRPVGIGRGLLPLNNAQPAQLITKQSNLMRQNVDQLAINNMSFNDAYFKQEQTPHEKSDVTNFATLMHNLQSEDINNANPFRDNTDNRSTTHSEYIINAKPFPSETTRLSVSPDSLEYSVNAKPFIGETEANSTNQSADNLHAKPFANERPSLNVQENVMRPGMFAQSKYKLENKDRLIQNTDETGPNQFKFIHEKKTDIQPRTVENREPEYTFDRFLSRGHCNICDIALTSVQHMEQHLSGRKHKNAKALKQTVSYQPVYNKELVCDVCLVTFTGPEAQEMHLKSDKHKKKLEQKNNKPAVFVCEVCNIECSGEDNYRRHLEGEKHMKRVNGPMPGQMFNKCEICNCFVNTLEQLEIHQRAKHPEKFRSNVEAGMSEVNTNLLSNLPTMNQGGRAITGRPGFFFCDVCKLECSGEDNYRQHLIGDKHRKKIAKGGNDKPDVFVCDVCQVECSGEENYKQHLAGEKHRKKAKGCIPNQISSQCEICNCVVNSQEQLLVHQKVKHPEKFQTVSVVGRERFDTLQTAIQGVGPHLSTNFADYSVGNRQGSFSNPLQEFLSLELFPEHKECENIENVGDNELTGQPPGDVGQFSSSNDKPLLVPEITTNPIVQIKSRVSNENCSAGAEHHSAGGKDPFITPEITTAQTVEIKPRFAAMPEASDSNLGQGQGLSSGAKKSQGSDLAWATKNRSMGNQNSSAGGAGNQVGDIGIRSQGTSHHFLDRLQGENPFAATHPFYCHTCKAPANTRESYETHLQGKRHMSKVGVEPAPARPHCEGQDLGPGFKPHTQSTPRDYQWELYYNAMTSDTVCFLPTGTGKTMVSVMLMSTMLETYPTRPVLFIVDKVLLVLQQSKYITTELGDFEFTRYNPDSQTLSDIGRRHLKIATLCMDQQSTHGVPLWKHDIVVVTAAFCQNLLDRKIMRWEDFSLVVFDEAHHCDKKHPFNMLLYSHHLKIYEGKYRPKILGLTASPAGKETVPATLSMLEKLVGNMGGVSMNIVQKHKSTLANFQSNAEIIIRPQPDQFNEIVAMFVFELHVYLIYCYLRLVPLSDIRVYLDLKDVNQSSNDDQIRLVAESYKMKEYYLEEFQLALVNIQCCEVENKYNVRLLGKHAESMCMTLNSLLEGGVPCALEEMTRLQNEVYNFEFAKTFKLPCEKLQAIYNHTKELSENPKEVQFGSHISRLVEELTNSLDIDWSQRETVKPMALVLVKERATVHKITQILQNNEVMRRLNLRVTSVVGHGKTGSEAAGMKVNQQKRILEEIKQYKYQVIVATSVAEEGVDWPECELVISLYPPSTLTALVQMRGRARKKNSKFVVLCSCEEERQNIEDLKKRENNMIEASEILFHRSYLSLETN